MWRGGVLVAIVVAAGIAAATCWAVGRGGGGGAFDVAACLHDPTASRADVETQQPPTFLTLQEVRQRYDWFRFPSELPPGATLGQLWARHLLCHPDVITVYARIDGPNYLILIEQSKQTATWEPKTPIEIDGGPGDVFDNGAVTIYSWNRDGHSYDVSTKFGGELTQETLLRSMNTLAQVSKDKTPASCNYLTPRSTASQLVSVPIDEVKKLMGFELLLPQDLPDGVTADTPFVTRSSLCPDNIFDVRITFRGPDYAFALMETKLSSEFGSPATPVMVNGFAGQMRLVNDNLLVEWRQGSVTITANAGIRGSLTQERFLQILESIPE